MALRGVVAVFVLLAGLACAELVVTQLEGGKARVTFSEENSDGTRGLVYDLVRDSHVIVLDELAHVSAASVKGNTLSIRSSEKMDLQPGHVVLGGQKDWGSPIAMKVESVEATENGIEATGSNADFLETFPDGRISFHCNREGCAGADRKHGIISTLSSWLHSIRDWIKHLIHGHFDKMFPLADMDTANSYSCSSNPNNECLFSYDASLHASVEFELSLEDAAVTEAQVVAQADAGVNINFHAETSGEKVWTSPVKTINEHDFPFSVLGFPLNLRQTFDFSSSLKADLHASGGVSAAVEGNLAYGYGFKNGEWAPASEHELTNTVNFDGDVSVEGKLQLNPVLAVTLDNILGVSMAIAPQLNLTTSATLGQSAWVEAQPSMQGGGAAWAQALGRKAEKDFHFFSWEGPKYHKDIAVAALSQEDSTNVGSNEIPSSAWIPVSACGALLVVGAAGIVARRKKLVRSKSAANTAAKKESLNVSLIAAQQADYNVV